MEITFDGPGIHVVVKNESTEKCYDASLALYMTITIDIVFIYMN